MGFFNKMTKALLQATRYKVLCETCHKVFHDLPYSEVLQYYPNMQQTEQSEFLVIDAQIHWCENPEHQVIMNMGGIQKDLGAVMREIMAQKGFTLPQVRDALVQKRTILQTKYQEFP